MQGGFGALECCFSVSFCRKYSCSRLLAIHWRLHFGHSAPTSLVCTFVRHVYVPKNPPILLLTVQCAAFVLQRLPVSSHQRVS